MHGGPFSRDRWGDIMCGTHCRFGCGLRVLGVSSFLELSFLEGQDRVDCIVFWTTSNTGW